VKKIKMKQYIVFALSICLILNINMYANGKTVKNNVVPVIKIGTVNINKIAIVNNKNKENNQKNKLNNVANVKSNTEEITKLDTATTTKTTQSTSIIKTVDNIKFEQLNRPVKGEEIAVIKTKLGVIKMKLLTNYAPKAVEIFKNRVSSGFYNGLSFNKLIGNSIVQGGTSGNIVENSQISTLVNNNLDVYNPETRNFKGAVSIASGDAGSIDQFVIVQAGPGKIIKDTLNYMKSSGDKLFPKQVITKYQKLGGAPWLDYHNVIFGQVFSGMEIVDKMSKSEVDENNIIKKEIKIVKITIETFK
jgi:peptidyl-prolyl cis-trans isomerase B (cyclophilin B)